MLSTIKKAEESDIPGLAILFDLYRVFYKKDSDGHGAERFLSDRVRKNESVIFIAVINNQIVGFTQLYPIFSSLAMKRSWLLNDLYVLEKFRGEGIAKQLLERSKQLARETGSAGLLLETEKTNIIGNELYPASGFILNDKNNFYWWDAG
jgi:GNAT superfamily N-acetyltransferase